MRQKKAADRQPSRGAVRTGGKKSKKHVAKPASATLIQRRVGATTRDRQIAAKTLRDLGL
jgi:hypothetical protein